MSGCIEATPPGCGSRKGPIPAVAIKETCQDDVAVNGHLTNGCNEAAVGLDSLRLSEGDYAQNGPASGDSKSAKSSRTKDRCCGGGNSGPPSSEHSSRKRQTETTTTRSCDQTTSPPEPSSSSPSPSGVEAAAAAAGGVTYHIYENELNMPDIMRLIQKDLSEPYSIYTYRYFIHNWPNLCFMARVDNECVGAIVCKLDYHKKVVKRGYIAMLAVDSKFRKRAIGSTLVQKAIEAMNAQEADEVVLETEITNRPALRLYENLGFVRDKRLFRYYLNGVDALRLKLWLR